MRFLGLDTSNYATSLAVIDSVREVVCAEKKLLPVQEGQLGLRQSEAVFKHTVQLPQLFASAREKGALQQLAAIGVSVRPRPQEGSYMPCFLVGQGLAEALASTLEVPLVQTSHQEGHFAAALYATGNAALWDAPLLMFHLSGGTTELVLSQGYRPQRLVGKSLDLYAGQAVDRLGVRLGFPFPAGAALSALAAEWGGTVPKAKPSMKGGNCHLSGLQNQCEKLLEQGNEPAMVAKFCLLAIADVVVAMLTAARKEYPGLPAVCAGGVMSSDIIRIRVEQVLPDVYFVPPAFASDNAVGAALIAQREGV